MSRQPGRTVADAVVAIVAGLTGYPSELLDLDLDLEADLGVDTVKQAEVFAAVRAEFGVAREDTLKLRDFPTLNHVIGWVASKVEQPTTAEPELIAEEPIPDACRSAVRRRAITRAGCLFRCSVRPSSGARRRTSCSTRPPASSS